MNALELFASTDSKNLERFYDITKTRSALINFAKNVYPHHHKYRLVERAGKTDLVVIIPTHSVTDESTQKVAGKFKGQHIIFIESKGIDPTFRYSDNVNLALKYSLRYKPEWIVVVDNDVVIHDTLNNLKKNLLNMPSSIDIISSSSHTETTVLLKKTGLSDMLLYLRNRILKKKISIKCQTLLKKYNVDYIMRTDARPFEKIIDHYKTAACFFVFRAQFVKNLNGYVYSTDFIHGGEDTTLCLRYQNLLQVINWRISDSGRTLAGAGDRRALKNIVGTVLVDRFIKDSLLNVSGSK